MQTFGVPAGTTPDTLGELTGMSSNFIETLTPVARRYIDFCCSLGGGVILTSVYRGAGIGGSATSDMGGQTEEAIYGGS